MRSDKESPVTDGRGDELIWRQLLRSGHRAGAAIALVLFGLGAVLMLLRAIFAGEQEVQAQSDVALAVASLALALYFLFEIRLSYMASYIQRVFAEKEEKRAKAPEKDEEEGPTAPK
jgi:hypothetical protein